MAAAPKNRPLALAGLALAAGIRVGLAGPTWPLLAIGVAAAIAGVSASARQSRAWLVSAALLVVAGGGLVIGLSAEQRARGDCRLRWSSGEAVRVEATAMGFLPTAERGMVRMTPVAGAAAGVCTWEATLRVLADGPIMPGVVYDVRGYWRPNQQVERLPMPVERRGWIGAEELLELRGSSWRRPTLWLRGLAARGLWAAYPERWAPFALALVLGQRETLSPEASRRMARAGLAHLLAISGLHVGMLAGAVFLLARLLRVGSRPAHLITVIATLAYVGLIGAPASAVRAGVMVLLWTLTRLAGRGSSPFDVLGLTALLLLLVRPWSVLEPGFQLTFAGAAAVGYAGSEARRVPWPESWPRPLRAAGASILASGATVALTAPITAAHFGRIAPAAVVGNLVAVPLLGLTMPALFVSALLSPWLDLAAWPAAAGILLLQAIDWTARLLAGSAWASFEVAHPSTLGSLVYLGLLVLAARALHGAWERRRLYLALGTAAACVLIGPALRSAVTSGRLEIYVVDVGQGDAIAIVTPGRNWLLVDAGPKGRRFDAGARRVVPFLREQGVRRLEAWLASHADLDHVGGGPAVLRALEVERVIGSGLITGQSGQVAVLRHLAGGEGHWVAVREGARIAVDEVELVFLHPDSALAVSPDLSPNDASLVFLLTFGRFRMLFTGDASSAIEAGLVRDYGGDLRAQVLKVGHHGSHTSSSSALLDAVRPELAVISVGRGNRYGHPSPVVLGRLAVRGVAVRRTDRDGTIAIEVSRHGRWSVRAAAEGF